MVFSRLVKKDFRETSETLLCKVNLIIPSISTWQLTIGYKVGPNNVADDVIFVHPEKKKKHNYFSVRSTEQTLKQV
jgi:hypothetical protein